MMNFQQRNNNQIPKIYVEILINAKYLHCCTIDHKQRPHVVPLIFLFDVDRCLILCVAGRKSAKVRNMQQNPYVTFSTDETHPINPLLNKGIMIETVVELSEDDNQIVEVMAKIQEKYNTLLDSKLVTTRVFDTDILIIAHPMKIVHWKGPFFHRFIFTKRRKKGIPFWSKDPSRSKPSN